MQAQALELLKKLSGQKAGAIHFGPVTSQNYGTGPVVWAVFLHANHGGGNEYPGQVAVACRRDRAQLEVRAEPRRDGRNGRRAPCSEVLLQDLREVASRVRTRLAAPKGGS
ncbi:MAG: hypothetical protein EBR73_13535 [Rhodobacteraceae bacterium]|jgi:hypothetical protein|nr:hypothetical protein [Paracoccaceae bacterium]